MVKIIFLSRNTLLLAQNLKLTSDVSFYKLNIYKALAPRCLASHSFFGTFSWPSQNEKYIQWENVTRVGCVKKIRIRAFLAFFVFHGKLTSLLNKLLQIYH